MQYSFPQDLQELITARLATGRYKTEDDLLRDAFRALGEEDDDQVAMHDALTEWRAGDEGTPLAEAFDEVRRAVDQERK